MNFDPNGKVAFYPQGKTPRFYRNVIITEKVDGTNAAVVVLGDGTVYAQSRKRVITPEDDNFGFAAWVKEHEDLFREHFGPGIHRGEWWGHGIQRGYGLARDERRFWLFSPEKYQKAVRDAFPTCSEIGIVPVLYVGTMTDACVQESLNTLRTFGSFCNIGYGNPEGIVIFHTASGVSFKVTLENDSIPKSLVGVQSD